MQAPLTHSVSRAVVQAAIRLACIALLLGAGACGPRQAQPRPNRDGGPDFAGIGLDCPTPPPDTDDDGISDFSEGASENPPRDTDQDGIPDFQDADSDGDGVFDLYEAQNGNPCTPPRDSDSDGVPDFRDLDSDDAANSTVPDKQELGGDPNAPRDTDGDGAPDFADPDNDGDGLIDLFELTPQGEPAAVRNAADAPDTDLDGLPDWVDPDADGDGIIDGREGIVDTDGDLVPNYRDLDSDGDCIPDAAEAGDSNLATPPVDSDADGAADFEDTDSDNDGLVDGKEDRNCSGTLDACETDRLIGDSDGDGVSDLIEDTACAVKPAAQQMACQCDGSDNSASPLTRGDFVFVVDYMQPPTPAQETLNLSTDVSQADVLFTLDTTGSMQACLNALAGGLAQIVPKVVAKVKSVAFGVVEFKDFQDSTVVSYRHRIQTVATGPGVTSVQSVLGGLAATGGGDGPEAGWVALKAITTAMSFSVNTGLGSVGISLGLANATPKPPTAGEVQGTEAGAGFRKGSVPIIVPVTDAEWHDGPGSLVGADPESGLNAYPVSSLLSSYCDPCTNAPSRRSVVTDLQALGAKVLGLAALGGSVTGDPKTRAIKLAQETGAVVTPADFGPVGVRPAGCAIGQCCTGQSGAGEAAVGGQCPLGYTVNGANGTGVSDAIVSGIVALASGLKFNIHVEASDVDPNTVDRFITRLQPNLSGLGPAAMCLTMAPSPLQDNFTGPKATPGADTVLDTFPGVGGGNQICFDVIPKMNTSVMSTGVPQLFRAQLQVKGASGMTTVNLGTPREVFFLVPPNIVNGPIN